MKDSKFTVMGCVLVMMIGISSGLAQDKAVPAAKPEDMTKPMIELGSPFCDNAVLQREMPVPVWGWSQPGMKVTVEFQGQKKSAAAGKDGKWSVTLDPLKASADPAKMVIQVAEGIEQKTVVVKNILVGEVWICSGQSNMGYGWHGVEKLAALADDARKKPIRSFHVQPTGSLKPNKLCKGAWSTDVSSSAVAFGFSYYLQQKLNVPVGVVVTSWGSSRIEGWMPRELTEQLPHFKTIMENFDADESKLNGLKAQLEKGNGSVSIRTQPNILYNAMMHPLIPYASRGLIWYQGEANAAPADPYAKSLPAWIKRLRKEWGRDDFHFLVVMLPGFGNNAWAHFREFQIGVLELPHTSIANTIDLGDAKNVHPSDKAPICERLVLLARRDVYGEKIKAQGPVFKSSAVNGNVVVIQLDHAEGLKTTDGTTPTGFQLGEDGLTWHSAKAEIKGTTVEVSTESLAAPKFVRYAFTGKPVVNLVNGAGLPAYPFRTDHARFAVKNKKGK